MTAARMPFNSSCRAEWASRLQILHSLRDEFPTGPTWLWNLRIRILEFLVNRYAASQESTDAGAEFLGSTLVERDPEGSSEWNWSAISLAPLPLCGIEHPPRSPEQLGLILDRINDQVESRRIPPSAIWSWWRDTFACRD